MIALVVFAQLVATPASTTVPARAPASASAQTGDPGDDCGGDARCRLQRMHQRKLAERRAAYLEQAARMADAIDQAEEERLPVRERHPLGVDLSMPINGPTWSVLVGYTFAWPVRVEFFAGKGTFYTSEGKATSSLYTSTENQVALDSYGVQGRWFIAPWMLTPVVTTGIGWSTGQFHTQMSVWNPRGGSTSSGADADASAHAVYGGLGLDLALGYFHLGLGYRLAWAFYTAARDPQSGRHLPELANALSTLLDGAMHSGVLELGGRY
jgi:hypothetical protein